MFRLIVIFLTIVLPIGFIADTSYTFYSKYKFLEKKVKEQAELIEKNETELKLARELNEDSLKKIKQLEQSIEINSQSVANLCEKNEKTDTRTNEVITNRRTREKRISKAYLEKTLDKDSFGKDFFKKYNIDENEDNELSEARINSLWQSYCSFNKCGDKNEPEYQDDGITK